MKKFAIIVPVFNEEEVIDKFYKVLLQELVKLDKEKYLPHIFFINNGSNDKSLDKLVELYKTTENCSILSLSRNFGYQNSLYFALKKINADLYTFIDVDCEDPPHLILDFIHKSESGYDVVYGKRVDRHEIFFIKSLRNIFYRVAKYFADDEIILYMAEFSLFTREVRDAVINEINSFPFIRSNIARVGFKRFGIPYKRDKRIAGKTNYNLISMFIFAIAGILTSSTLLLRIPIYCFPIILLFIIMNIFTEFFLASDIFLILLLFIFFTLSIVALYIARIYKNQFNRPSAYLSYKNSHIRNENFISKKD